jgi:hypothetical protein
MKKRCELLKLVSESDRKSSFFDLENTYSEDVEFTSRLCSISIGAFAYGIDKIDIQSWGGEGSNISIRRFCSIAGDFKVILGRNHWLDWITTYPFGFIHNSFFQGLPDLSVIY